MLSSLAYQKCWHEKQYYEDDAYERRGRRRPMLEEKVDSRLGRFRQGCRQRLRTLTQGRMSVREYFNEMVMALAGAQIKEAEEVMMVRFFRGLNQDITNHLQFLDVYSLEDMLIKAINIEKQGKTRSSYPSVTSAQDEKGASVECNMSEQETTFAGIENINNIESIKGELSEKKESEKNSPHEKSEHGLTFSSSCVFSLGQQERDVLKEKELSKLQQLEWAALGNPFPSCVSFVDSNRIVVLKESDSRANLFEGKGDDTILAPWLAPLKLIQSLYMETRQETLLDQAFTHRRTWKVAWRHLAQGDEDVADLDSRANPSQDGGDDTIPAASRSRTSPVCSRSRTSSRRRHNRQLRRNPAGAVQDQIVRSSPFQKLQDVSFHLGQVSAHLAQWFKSYRGRHYGAQSVRETTYNLKFRPKPWPDDGELDMSCWNAFNYIYIYFN